MLKDFYDESEPIVTFEAFYGPKKHLVDTCIITFSTVIQEELLKTYSCTKLTEMRACNGNIPVWSLEYKGEKIAFYLSPMGSALAGSAVLEVNHLTGAHRFIMSGSCGSLDGKKTAGKFILPAEAYRGEGMSYYFAPAQDYITIRNAGKLASIFDELRIPYVSGRVWTVDCMLRETVNLVRERVQEGCIAVEMELAGVQAVCDYYGFELYDFLAAGDVLAEENYETEGLADANHNVDKLQIALCIAEKIRG